MRKVQPMRIRRDVERNQRDGAPSAANIDHQEAIAGGGVDPLRGCRLRQSAWAPRLAGRQAAEGGGPISPLEAEHALPCRLKANLGERYLGVLPPPAGWDPAGWD